MFCAVLCAYCIKERKEEHFQTLIPCYPIKPWFVVVLCSFRFHHQCFFLCVSIFLCFACVTVTAASGCNGKWELSCTEKKKKSRTEGLYNISQFSLPRINEQKCLLDFKNRRKSVLITVYDLWAVRSCRFRIFFPTK